MTGAELAARVAYPPAPWTMSGLMSMGFFRLQETWKDPMPHGLQPLLARTLVVTLVRYHHGTLRYDELVLGSLARRGVRLGIFVRCIWVDSEESVAGGRRIWGVPKEMARFHWTDDTVTVDDADGHIATLTVKQEPARLPAVPIVGPGFGLRDGQLVFSNALMRARLRRSSLRVERWSSRFQGIASEPVFGFDAAPFHMHLGEPRVLPP